MTPFIAAYLPFLQLVLGLALIFVPRLRRTALWFSFLVFVLYATAQILAYRRGLEIPCGCFGDSTKLISFQTILIPCVAAVVALLAWLLSWRLDRLARATQSAPPPSEPSPTAVRPGFTLLELLVVVAIIGLLIGLLLSAVQKVRSSAARLECHNKLRQLTLATHQYHDAKQQFPPGLSVETNRREFPYLSWQARCLPFLEQPSLWSQIEDAFASDPAPMIFYGHSPHLAIMATPVKVLQCPLDPRLGRPFLRGGILLSHTSYLGVQGLNQTQRNGVFYLDSTTRLSDITDGTSQTLLIGERPPDTLMRFGWWYRGWGQEQDGSCEMLLGVRELNRKFPECPASGSFKPGQLTEFCDVLNFWSLHSGGGNFALADGSVRFLRYEADALMPALASRQGRESVQVP